MKTDRFYLEIALEEAEQAGREGTYPIGALIVGPDGSILSTGHNRVYRQAITPLTPKSMRCSG